MPLKKGATKNASKDAFEERDNSPTPFTGELDCSSESNDKTKFIGNDDLVHPSKFTPTESGLNNDTNTQSCWMKKQDGLNQVVLPGSQECSQAVEDSINNMHAKKQNGPNENAKVRVLQVRQNSF